MTTPHFDSAKPHGIHADISDDAYSAAAGVRRSELKILASGTPKDVIYYRSHGIGDSPALRIGSATDLAVLTPELYGERVAESDIATRRSAAWRDFEDVHTGKLCLTASEAQQVHDLTAAVAQSKQAQHWLAGTQRQLSAWWDHTTLHGDTLLCKTRPDAVIADKGRTLDLKTCQDLDDHSLNRSCRDYAYDLQAYMNAEGFLSQGFDWKEHIIIFVRKRPPIDVRCVVMTISSPWLTRAEHVFNQVTTRYAHMVKNDERHGWDTRATSLPMENWIENETLELERQALELQNHNPNKTND